MQNINIYEISHELKNPLAIINGYLDMISYSNKEETNNYLRIIKDEVNKSISILNNILSYNKINKKEFYIEELFNDLNNSTLPLIKDKYIKVFYKSESNLKMFSDYDKLKEVLINIIKNSIESISYYGIIYVFSYEINNQITITIKDNGKGINKKILKYINSNKSITTKKDGNGIGILYSKEIINKLNGNIKYYSTINKGTLVKIIIPK